MNYRKLKADYLFTGTKLLRDGEVLIATPAGEIIAIINNEDAGGDIEIYQGIITPGFINVHCHLELSHMKGLIPERTGLVDFVCKVISERHFAEEEIINAVDKAEEQMRQNGIVAVGDICNTALTLPQKRKQNLHYYNFIETSGWSPVLAISRWERSKNLIHQFAENNLTAAIVPHAPYSVSTDLWKKIMPFFKGKTISIHNQETAFEDELFLTGSGGFLTMYEKLGIDNSFFIPVKQTSVQSYFSKLSKAAAVILVHNTFISQEDINYINNHKPGAQFVYFCLCANANLYIEDALPPVAMLQKNNCSIVLGTDSLASNWSLSILDELKTLHQHFAFLPLEQTLQWATLNGARALQMDHTLGSFDTGKKPGVVLIENIEELNLKSTSGIQKIL